MAGRVPLNSSYYFKNIEYIKTVQKGVYDPKRKSFWDVGNWVENEDLPQLRAKFIEQFIINDDLNRLRPPIILQGHVTKQITEADRNVELILFVRNKN